MTRSTVPVIGGASLMLAALAGCSLYEPDVDVKPALTINGQSLVGDAQRQYDLGKLYLSQGRFAAAAQAFQMAATAKRPPSIEVLNALAVAYDNLGRYDLADEYYRQALNQDSRNAQTLNNFGISLARRGMPDRAALVLAEAARTEPKNETVTANLAEVRAETTRAAEAPAPSPSAPAVAVVPEEPAVPRVERVGLKTLELVTQTEEPRAEAAAPAIARVEPPATPAIAPAAPHVASAVARAEPSAQVAISTEPETSVFASVARVGMEIVQLVTGRSAPRTDATSPAVTDVASPAPTPTKEETVASAPRPRVVAVEIAAAPDAVKPVTVAATAERVVVDNPMAIDQVALHEEESAVRKVQARVEVSNGAGRTRMATRMRGYLAGRGVTVARVTNDSSFSNKTTVIFYRPGFEQAAEQLSKSLPVPVATAPAPKLATDVRVRLGRDMVSFDLSLQEKKKA